ncbi:MAG: M14 family metallopeptidase, partial [Actinomycetota bacterium]
MRNHRRAGLAALTAVVVLASLAGSADAHQRNQTADEQTTEAGSTQLPASGAVASGQSLEMYEATVDGGTLQELVSQGYDVTHVEDTAQGSRVALVLSPGEHRILQAKGVDMKVSRTEQGLSASRLAAQQAQDGFEVYRSFDENGGIRDEMYRIARQNRNLVKLEVLGETIEGREYIALKVTQNARTVPDNSRPAVLYVSTHHAREWISTEVNRRLLHWYIDEFKAGNPTVTNLLQTTELWFVLVHNPDGYEYTFDVERLWRKNLRDNDGDGQITNADGVDPNRNYDEHWNYDDEGSATQIADETFRGTTPESEPETQALVSLFDDVDFEFAISYHSFGPLLLYTQGWQVLTPSADDPIYMALTGDDNDPAIPGSNPGVGADLYTTNGEFTDWAHGDRGTLAWTPELNEGCEGCGFVFPDDEALIQDEFELTRDFAVNVAKSAGDPDDPESHWGMDTEGLYVNEAELDPWKSTWPQSDLRVETSYAGGSSQPVEVLAKRADGTVTLHYSINGETAQTAPTSESPPGERSGGNNAYNVYYHYLRGDVPGLDVGDSVEYWFTGGGEATEHATFKVVED